MIGRATKVRLAVFAVITVALVFYVGGNYVGLNKMLYAKPYTVSVHLPSSGGIFSNAEVTERGVPVGRVGALHLTADGVAVDLQIDRGKRIPAHSAVVVADRSAVGEQYVDLQPKDAGPPYLHDGSVIDAPHATEPVEVPTVLKHLDDLATSIGKPQLKNLVDELGTAFQGTGPDLARLVDSTDKLTTAMQKALPDTVALLDSSRTVLGTQVDTAGDLRSFSGDLALLTAQLRRSNPDLEAVITRAAPAATAVDDLLRDNEARLPTLLANLLDVGQILGQKDRLIGTEDVLVAFPRMVQDTFNTVRGDGTARLGLVLDYSVGVCSRGYESSGPMPAQDTQHRLGLDPAWRANLNAYCALPHNSPISVRGAQNLPRPPGDPTQYPPSAGNHPVDNRPPVPQPGGGGTGTSAPTSEPALPTSVPRGSLEYLMLAPLYGEGS